MGNGAVFSCSCGTVPTIQHNFEECPNTKFDGEIAKLHDRGS